MSTIPRKKIAPDFKFYKSLGLLIKDYRQWRELSQETFAAAVGISVRALQNWEADRHRARIDNLHDLSEVAGIPMQVCVALSAGQPLWYSLGGRRFAYSAVETVNFSLDELFKYREKTDDETLIKIDRISTAHHISAILSCHRDIYGARKSVAKEAIQAAVSLVPELNIIAFDSWGHYVGHHVCFPIKYDVYQELKKNVPFEAYLTSANISDVETLKEGVFICYSLFAASWNVGHLLLKITAPYYARIRQQGRYMIACWAPTKEIKRTSEMLGMQIVQAEGQEHPPRDVVPALYEIGLDALVRRYEQLGVLPGALTGTDDGRGKNLTANLPGNGPLIVDEERTETCPNPQCVLHNKMGQGNVIHNGTYRTKAGALSRRFICKECGESFCSRANTIFYDLRSSEEKVLLALKLLIKGMPLRGVAEVLKVKRDTARHWLAVAAEDSEKIDALLMKELKVSRAELDALWTFVKKNSLRRRAVLWKTQKATHTVMQQE